MSSTLGNKTLFPRKSLIGMVHVRALPGTPASELSIGTIIDIAVKEAKLLEELGFDQVLLENMHDTPYLNRNVGSEIVAAMTAIACAVRQAIKIPFGIQILAGANKEALSVALVSGASFIRSECFVFSSVADEGIMNSDAGELLRYRAGLHANNICIFADVKKKHSAHAITSDISIGEYAKAAHFFRSDGVIVTGPATATPASVAEVKEVWGAVLGGDGGGGEGGGGDKPRPVYVLIGSGITPSNLSQYWDYADAFIVGSYIKAHGHWENEIDTVRSKAVVDAANALREKKK